jgi:hypothetical protein
MCVWVSASVYVYGVRVSTCGCGSVCMPAWCLCVCISVVCVMVVGGGGVQESSFVCCSVPMSSPCTGLIMCPRRGGGCIAGAGDRVH